MHFLNEFSAVFVDLISQVLVLFAIRPCNMCCITSRTIVPEFTVKLFKITAITTRNEINFNKFPLCYVVFCI